ncbi:hypothetical protein [Caulobacter sp. LARHSG274]
MSDRPGSERPQKHARRVRIIMLTADGIGAAGITAATGKDKTYAVPAGAVHA